MIRVNTLRAPEEVLLDFTGWVVVISQDRRFPDRIATPMRAFEGNSQMYCVEGNHSEYEENHHKRPGSKYHPERIHYKKRVPR